jgi:tripartite-type tricarboxylate transporter receptor subunit TctC
MNRRELLYRGLQATGAAGVASVSWPAIAQPQPIKVIVPAAPGTGTDVISRFMTKAMEAGLGTSLVVDNKPGAGGVIGTELAVRAPADGSTILINSSNHFVLPWVYEKLSFDAKRDFEPIAAFGQSTLMMVVSANSPFNTVSDILAAARKPGAEMSYSSAGNGTLSHICGAQLASMGDVPLRHVPYKAGAQGLVDVSAGLVNIGFQGIAVALPLIAAGRLKPIAVTGLKRSSHSPEIPTVAESGLPKYDIDSIFLALAPRGTPSNVIEKYSKLIKSVCATAEFEKFCMAQGLEATAGYSAAELAAVMPAQFARWQMLAKTTQAKTS